MDFIASILWIMVVALIVSAIWNIISLRQLKKRTFATNEQLNDSKYYELKSKHEYLMAVVTVTTTSIIFLGYNSVQSLEEKIKLEYDKKVDSTNSKLLATEEKLNLLSGGIEKKLLATDTTLTKYQSLISYLENRQSSIQQNAKLSQEGITEVLEKIKQLNEKNILKQNFYLVNATYLPPKKSESDEDFYNVIYFKDLITTIGDRLPKFTLPPFIIVTAPSGGVGQAYIKDITNESFKVGFFEYHAGNGNDGTQSEKINLFISEKSSK